MSDPNVPPLLHCNRCRKQMPWVHRNGAYFCAICDTRNGMTVAADDKRRAEWRR